MKVFRTLRKIAFGALMFLAVFELAAAADFSDVSSDHPNAEAIDYLSKEGIISGYPDGSFGPERSVNRAEALKILLLASGIPSNTSPSGNFPDVSSDAWFAPFVFSAHAREIVNGYPDGYFRPEQTVNLVEALKMLLQANSVSLTNYKTSEQLFSDAEQNAWYNTYLLYAKTFEIVEADSSDRIFPATPLTRAALAEIVYRFQTRVERVCPQFLGNTKTTSANYFREITLADELPNIFYENEVFAVRGSVTNSADSVLALLEDRSTGEQDQFSVDVKNGAFTVPVAFHTPGNYNFTIIPSTADRNVATTVEVLPWECQPATVTANGTAPTNIRTGLTDNKPTLSWDVSGNNIFRVVIRQDDNRYEKLVSGNQSSLMLDPADFEAFSEGTATVQIFGAQANKGWSFEPRSEWFGSTITTLELSQHHFSTYDKDKITLPSLPVYRGPRISFTGTAKVDLDSDAYLITPRGTVQTISIVDSAEKIPAGSQFSLDLQLSEVGVYILEINGTNGIAVLNHPLYLPNEFQVIPDFSDLREAPDSNRRLSLNRERSIWLRVVNEFRAQHQLSRVNLDSELSTFAQQYAQEMASKNFFGHVDLNGNDPDERRKIFGLNLPVGENLARDIKTEYAHEGLLRSAAHRENILAPEWERVGLGIAEDSKGNWLFVQEFSTGLLSQESISGLQTELLEEINMLRSEQGLPNLALDSLLGSVAQDWSEKMVAEDFLDFTHIDSSLQNTIRATGYNGSFSSFIATARTVSQIAENLNEQVFADPTKSYAAIGLAQDTDGILRATLIFR